MTRMKFRLAFLVERLHRGVNTNEPPDKTDRLMVEAADEIERLRAALKSLTEDPPATLDEPDEDYEVIWKMRAIAREALGIEPAMPEIELRYLRERPNERTRLEAEVERLRDERDALRAEVIQLRRTMLRTESF